jgi:hypothetical protein
VILFAWTTWGVKMLTGSVYAFTPSSADWIIENNGDGTVSLTPTFVGGPVTIGVPGEYTLPDLLPPDSGPIAVVGSGTALEFPDKTIFVENAENADLARLYLGLDRTPDVGGLVGWETILNNNTQAPASASGLYQKFADADYGTGTSIAGGFLQSAEFQHKYGNLDDSHFVTRLYLNVLNRAPDTTEVNAWLNLIHNGDAEGTHYTQAMVLVGIAESAESIAKTAHAGGWLIQV